MKLLNIYERRKMKQFDIYENPLAHLEAVKVGFCWPGFFFGILWALFCKLWKLAAIIFLITLTVNVVGSNITTVAGKEVFDAFSTLYGFAIMLGLGFSGNKLRAKNLISRGYEFKASEIFDNKDGAIAEYVRRSKKQP